MRPPAPPAERVFRELYPNAEPNDPDSLEEYAEYFLVPELRVELDLFYGSLDKEDHYLRKCRRPGVDYNDRGWRIRMTKWYYHAELYQVFEKLQLRSWEIDEVCMWWGSKAEVSEFERFHPGMVVGDDIWDGIAVAPRFGPPTAYIHDPNDTRLPPPRKRSSRLRRMITRPRAIRSWRDLQRSGSSGESSSGTPFREVYEQDAITREPSSPEYEDDIVRNSVGVSLNHDLRTGGRSPAFDEWFKDELDNGHLPSSSSMGTPFQVSTNTISYRATPHHAMTMPSYTQRMLSGSQAPLPAMPVTVSGLGEGSPRSSQPRQSSPVRYHQRIPRQHQYRAIRPRPPLRHSSRN